MLAGTAGHGARDGALEAVFLGVLPRMVIQAKESSAPARGLMAFGLLMFIAKLRAEGVTVTKAELGRRLDKSQQMFSPHIDNLVELGFLTATKVPGGHGTGTQWHLDLVDPRIVDALRPLMVDGVLAMDGAGAAVPEVRLRGDIRPASARDPGSTKSVTALATSRPRRRAPRPAPRSPA